MAQGLFENYIEEIALRVDALRSEGVSPVVIGMDGMAASGKTTLAALLAERLDASVIHMDDFFLPQGFRTPERLRTPGGNVYYERFCQEVKPYIRSGKLFGYRVFDAHKHVYVDTRDVWPKPVIIVEGCYCMHPEIGDIYDLRLFVEVSPYEQEQRIAATRAKVADMYKAMWIPMENRYHKAFGIKEQCDMVITSGEPQPAPPLEIERKWLIRMPDLALLRDKAERVIAIEHVALVPVGIFLRKPADDRVVVSGPEVVRPGFLVVILPGVSEGIGVRGNRIFLVAKGITLFKYLLF